MDKAQRAEFIRRASFISEASRDERAGFVDEIAQAAAPQPPSASGEWAAFRSACWTKATEPAIGHMHGQDAAWWGWMARAALAPSPGIDAAGQNSSSNEAWLDHATAPIFSVFHMAGDEPFVSAIKGRVVLHTLKTLERDLLENLNEYFTQGDGDYLFTGVWQHADPDVGAPAGYELELIRFTPLEAAPPAEQPSAEWVAEAERLVHRLVQSSTVEGAGKWPFVSVDNVQAALLAHLKQGIVDD